MPGPAPADRPLPAHARVVVVGAGFSGVAAAVALERSGEHDVVLLEQADEVGGTWRDNAYPGCACDVPEPPVPAVLRAQPGLVALLRPAAGDPALPRRRRPGGSACATKVRFGTGLERAAWDGAAGRWRGHDHARDA